MMNMENQDREIKEAIMAGKRALSSLNEAEKHLGYARGFGIWDMLGGGFISSMIKHSKMDDAQRCMERAQMELQNFSKELEDVSMSGYLKINFDGLTKFIDMFCDNFLVDVLVQSRIRDTQTQIAEIKRQVATTINQLEQMQKY